MNKTVKILLIVLGMVALACLIGLIVTGYMIGWGPFAPLRYYNHKTYAITETTYPYTKEKKTIEGPNGTIIGYLYLAQTGEEKQPLVILSHGLATEQWHNLNTADSLANAGISVFMFDYCGGSIHTESDGKTTDMSILTERADLSAVIDAAKTWDGIDQERIGIIGYSQGGLVAAITAAERDDIWRLCLQYPAFSMYGEIRSTYSTADSIPDTIDRNGMLTGRVYYEDVVTFPAENIYDYAAGYAGPVLLIHGTADLLVPYASSVTANETYSNSELITIEGAGHGFTGEDDVYSVRMEYEFFTK